MSLYPCSGVVRHPSEFLQGGDALLHPAQTVFAQAAHAMAAGGRTQRVLGGLAVDQFAHIVIDDEQFVYARTTPVAGLTTLVAARRIPGGGAVFVAGSAGGAELAHQALREHAPPRRGAPTGF